jgi:hypothetical protein
MDDIIASLSSDFPDSPGGAATPPSDGEPSEGSTAQPDEGATAQAESTTQPPSEEPAAPTGVNLAKLQELAEARAKQRATEPPPRQEQAEAANALTPEALVKAFREGDTFRAAVTAAVRDGDLDALAKLTADDPSKADAAGVYERMTRRALDPTGAAAADRIAKLEAEIESMKAGKLPDDVVTESKLQEREHQRAIAANRAAFSETVSNAEEYPFLAAIDPSEALRYGIEADTLLAEHGQERSTALVSRIAEEIASSRLGGLRAQNAGAAAKTQGGGQVQQAAGAATVGETQAHGAIDNRAASTTAAAMPDVDDEDGWERHSRNLMRSRAQ